MEEERGNHSKRLKTLPVEPMEAQPPEQPESIAERGIEETDGSSVPVERRRSPRLIERAQRSPTVASSSSGEAGIDRHYATIVQEEPGSTQVPGGQSSRTLVDSRRASIVELGTARFHEPLERERELSRQFGLEGQAPDIIDSFKKEQMRIIFEDAFLDDFNTSTPVENVIAFNDKCKELGKACGDLAIKLKGFLDENGMKLVTENLARFIQSPIENSIWNCLVANQPSVDSILTDLKKFKALFKKLKQLKSSIRKYRILAQAIPFDVAREKYRAALDTYLYIAGFIIESEEMQTFVKELHEINREPAPPNTPFKYKSFSFVCDSSGSGKTQLALSMTIPSLFFVLSRIINQPIYNTYATQCAALVDFLESDKARFVAEQKAKHGDSFQGPDYTVDAIQESKLKFQSVGFLVGMAQSLIRERQNSGSSKFSAEIQFEMKGVTVVPLTFAEAIAELQKTLEMLTGPSGLKYYVLPIFFDECSISESFLTSELFLFLRGVVRCMLCTPIFMGTDAKPSNFIGGSLVRAEKVSRTTEPKTWCLLWHRLPKVSMKLVNEKIEYYTTKLKELRRGEEGVYPTFESLSFLFRCLQDERPLFFSYTIRILDSIIAENTKFTSEMEFFKYICRSILYNFRNQKKEHLKFNTGQIAYMTSFYWNDDLHIHTHAARLDALNYDKTRPYYSKITALIESTNDKGIASYGRYYLTDSGGLSDFTISSKYDSFSSTPLLGLVLTGLDAADNYVLLMKEREVSWRCSVLNTIRSYTSGRTGFLPGLAGPSTSGTLLEFALLCSLILASREGGLKGTGIVTFLNHLCFELDICGMVRSEKVPVRLTSVPQQLVDDMKAFGISPIPFLAPMASESWPAHIVEGLTKMNNGNVPKLGTAYPSVVKSSRADCAVARWSEDMPLLPKNTLPADPLIVGQCKLYSSSVDASLVKKEVFPSFDAYEGCNLFFLVAPEFTDMQSLRSHRNSKYYLWSIKRSGTELLLDDTYVEQKSSAKKHVIIISLKELNSGGEVEYARAIESLISQR